MKRLFTTLFSLTLTAAAWAAGTEWMPADTVVRVVRPDSVVVLENDSSTEVKIFGKDNNPHYSFSYSKTFSSETLTKASERADLWNITLPLQNKPASERKGFSLLLFNDISVGYGFAVDNPTSTGLHSVWQFSVELLGVKAYLPGSRDYFSLGVGMEANLISQHTSQMWGQTNSGVGLLPPPEGSYNHRSTLTDCAWTLPLHYGHRFGPIWVDLAAIGQLHLKPRISNTYEVGNREYTHTFRHLKANDLSLSYRLTLTYKNNLGLYVQYNPNYLFDAPQSPRFRLLTVGLSL